MATSLSKGFHPTHPAGGHCGQLAGWVPKPEKGRTMATQQKSPGGARLIHSIIPESSMLSQRHQEEGPVQ